MTRKFYLFTVMTALFMLATPSLWAQSSGTCGENVTWTLDDQGVLTIEGTGAMKDITDDEIGPFETLSFTKAIIKDGVTSIGRFIFYSSSGMTSVSIPNSVTSIGECAFYNCKGLISVDIPNSVTSIGQRAFYDCTGLTSVTIPSSVTTINQFAFYGCDGLKSVTIPNTVTSIGKAAFGYCSGLTSVVIPNSVTSIAWGAFGGCTGLTSVTIPSSVTTIEDQTFAQCSGLKEVTCLAVTPPTCGNYVFYNVSMDSCTLSVPTASIDEYKAADVWKDFNNIVSGINGVSQESNVGVSASDGVITVTGTADNAVVEVYNISGMLVYRGTSNTIAVPSAGVYVVKAAGKTVKVNAAR